ncbi:alpha/beta hydrolase [Tissierella creatinini]|nr:alpha/beta hydrolase [Tissierella creatinini]TJX66497.1 alpha/beta hydrolase [Soehngenia saccharolytica]
MKSIKKAFLKVLSIPHLNLKKYYRQYRKILNAVMAPVKPPHHKLIDHKIMVEDREIPIRVFKPEKNPLNKVLVFFHGGGWVTGNIDTYSNVCANMADETRHLVISVDYRLAPEYPYPNGLEDCYHATREIFTHLELIDCYDRDITLIGDSAGANLAAAVSLMARDRGEFLPRKQILIYPATNNDYSNSSPYKSVIENGTGYVMTTKKIKDYMDLYVPKEEDRKSPYFAPILSDDLSNQPSTLIITAEFDPLRDEGEAYGHKLKRFGNYVKIYRINDALHGFFSNPLNNIDTNLAYEKINQFLID